MVRLAGTPEQIGTIWGEMNKEIISSDIEAAYVKRATAAGISRKSLLERSAASVRIIQEIAPHWLEEARAIARAAGVPEDLYIAYLDGAVRSRFLHEDPEECTSYAVSPNHARDGAIMFHKTRDNRDMPQAVYIVESSLEEINKFIAVSNATGILGFSMMVNEKGLAGAGDYPANRKKDSSTLHLEPAPNKFRGVMSGTILRHIAERASNCAEALAIIEDCVAKGWYSGGNVGGTHWLRSTNSQWVPPTFPPEYQPFATQSSIIASASAQFDARSAMCRRMVPDITPRNLLGAGSRYRVDESFLRLAG